MIVMFISSREGGTIEKVGMKMSGNKVDTSYIYQINISCPYCKINLSVPKQGSWKCDQCGKIFIYYHNNVYRTEEIHSMVAIYLTAILAKYCKGNGNVTKNELDIVENNLRTFLNASNAQMNSLKKLFNSEAKKDENFEEHLLDLYDLVQASTESKQAISNFLLESMFQIGTSNVEGKIDEKHNEMIFRVVNTFNVDMKYFEILKERYIKEVDYMKY